MEKEKLISDKTNHKQQTFWQVWIPLICGILVVFSLAFFILFSTSGNDVESGRIAGFSTVILIFPVLIVSLFFLVFLALLIFGVYKLTEIIPVYSFKLLMAVVIASDFVKLWLDRLSNLLITLNAWESRINRIFTIFLPKNNK